RFEELSTDFRGLAVIWATRPVSGPHELAGSLLGACQRPAQPAAQRVSWQQQRLSVRKEHAVSGSRRIIVGTSGAPGSLPALRYAAELARQDDATLIPVLAWLPPGGDVADRRCPSSYLRQIWKDAAWLRLWAALDSAWGGIAPAGRPAEPLVRRGEPGE